MKSLIAAVFLLILGFSLAESYVLVCYYTNWAQYRPNGARFVPENIDPALCTHLVYASAKVGKEYNLKMTLWNDAIMYRRIMQLKKKNRKLKILLSVDGSFENQGRTSAFSTMISESSKRQTFINSTVNFLNKWKFDGLDINWKFYRNIHGKIPNVDKQSISRLIVGLKKAFDMESKNGERPLLLTAAVPPQVAVTEKSFDLKIFENSLDWISLKTYDLHGHWEKVTGHHTAMESDGAGNPEERKKATLPYVVDYWLRKGFPSNKLVLGLATYGRSFKLLSRRNNGLGATTSFERPVKGKLTGFTGFHAYYEICKNGFNVVVENQALAPYAYRNYDWISYDDALSLKLKIQALVKRKNLFGAMFRSLALDDFSGRFCGEGKHPLVKSVSTELGISAPYPSLKKDAPPEEVFFNTRTDELAENMIPLEPTKPTKRFDPTSALPNKNNGRKENDVSDDKTDANDSIVQKLEVSTKEPSEKSTEAVKRTIPPTDIKTSETPITSTKTSINYVEDTSPPSTTTTSTTTTTTTTTSTTTTTTPVQSIVSTVRPKTTIKNVITETKEVQFPFQKSPMKFDKNTGRLLPDDEGKSVQRKPSTNTPGKQLEKSTVATTSTVPTQITLTTSTTGPTSTMKASTNEVQFPFQTKPMTFDKTTGRLVPDTTENTVQSTTESEPTQNTLGTSTIALTSTVEASTNEVQSPFTEESSSQSTSTKPTENTFTSSTDASTTTIKASTKEEQSASTMTPPSSTTTPPPSSTEPTQTSSSSSTTTASTKPTENTFSSSTEASTTTIKASNNDVQSTSTTTPPSSTTTPTTSSTTTPATTTKRSLKTVPPKTTKNIVREVQFPFQKDLMKFDKDTGRLVFKSKSTIAPKTTIKMAPREIQFPFQKELMKFDKVTGRLIFKSKEKFQSKRSMEPKSKRNLLARPVNFEISALETPPPLHERLMRAKKIAEKLANKGKKIPASRPRKSSVSPTTSSLVTEPSKSSLDSSFSMHHIFSSSIPAVNTYTTAQLESSVSPSSYIATDSMNSVLAKNNFKPSSSALTFSKKSDWAEKVTVSVTFPEWNGFSVSEPFRQATPSLNHRSIDIMKVEQSSYVRSEKSSVQSSKNNSFKVSSTASIPNDMMSSFYNKYNDELSYYNQITTSAVKKNMRTGTIEATPSLSATPSITEGLNSKLDIESSKGSKGQIVSPTLSSYSINYAINTRVVAPSSVSNDYITSSRYI